MGKLFADGDLGKYLRANLERALSVVREEENLLNLPEEQYAGHLVDRLRVPRLVLHWDRISRSEREEMIDAQFFNPLTLHPGTRALPRPVITVHIPFSGSSDLLWLQPSTFTFWTHSARVAGSELEIEFVDVNKNPADVGRQFEELRRRVEEFVTNSGKQVDAHNIELGAHVAAAVRARRDELNARKAGYDALGIPKRPSSASSSPTAIPLPSKPALVTPKPVPHAAAEFTISEEDYQRILKALFDLGVGMERTPSLYEKKDEEALRDALVAMLGSHFQSSTGETFNKTGKTDILVRHEKANIFVAECKFWAGSKLFGATVDQLLGYLTWRESKAAILVFVNNREIAPVIAQIEPAAKTHRCYMRSHPKKSDGWFDFDFHLPDDPGRVVRLAVLLFHFPPPGKA